MAAPAPTLPGAVRCIARRSHYGKGLNNGVPIGTYLARPAAEVFQAGNHGTTFGGNPSPAAPP